MAKMVLSEPPAWSNRRLTLNLEKPQLDERIEISHGDSGEKLLELTVEKGTRNLVVDVTDSPQVIVRGNTIKGGSAKPRKFPKMKNKDKSWRMDKNEDGKDVFVCWLPNGKEIELEVFEPGPYTPVDTPETPIHEVVGQQEMLFAIALGISQGKHSLLVGPTGIAKTTMYRWLASKLGYNFVVMPIARGTQDRHLIGEYMPAGPGDFQWTDGPVTKAARLSQEHPTILMFDELNRIGNIAEFSRVYQLLDDTRMIELPEKRKDDGTVEIIRAGKLFVGGTANPVDDEGGDYIGVKELDPALTSRFAIQPPLKYPPIEIEARALCDRVESLDAATATKMVKAATRIRESADIRFPISFRELEAWALAVPFYGYKDAAEVGVISKAAPEFRPDIRNLLQLQG